MLVSAFDYDLPPELIAQEPIPDRDHSKMMVLERRTGKIIHSIFKEFPDFLDKKDVLILNSAKVIPAKIWGQMDQKDIEFLFLREVQKEKWEVLCRPAKRVRKGESVIFPGDLEGRVVDEMEEGRRILLFPSGGVFPMLEKKGFAPLPPYIRRNKKEEQRRRLDLERYQTVYAKKRGAIAAPTAGLHFTPMLLRRIQEKGVLVIRIRLDVGLATFQPVRVKRTEDHKMLRETYSISIGAAKSLNQACKEDKNISAVGTTSVRTLESAFKNGKIRSGSRSTDLFIYPGYTFRVVDRLLTNFHLPRSTLLMLVSAFADLDLVKKAYQEAVQKKYRFYSYGDCMYII